MGSWGFVALAYGVAMIALAGYLIFLGRRLREMGEELTALEREGERKRR
ncbi:MAG TPA: CcmD family protein [Candidatus Methylomirabilis sp.]